MTENTKSSILDQLISASVKPDELRQLDGTNPLHFGPGFGAVPFRAIKVGGDEWLVIGEPAPMTATQKAHRQEIDRCVSEARRDRSLRAILDLFGKAALDIGMPEEQQRAFAWAFKKQFDKQAREERNPWGYWP